MVPFEVVHELLESGVTASEVWLFRVVVVIEGENVVMVFGVDAFTFKGFGK